MRARRGLCPLMLALTLTACGGDDVAAPRVPGDPPPVDVLPVGTPLSPGLALSSPVTGDSLVPPGGTVVYVSTVSGTRANAVQATVTVGGARMPITATIIDGGFDPVAVPATEGDSIRVALLDSTGGVTVLVGSARRPVAPRVVRTSPRTGRSDVPLNSLVQVVFSAPMDPTTLPSSLQLSAAGVVVPGTVRLRTDGLLAEFVPAATLAPETNYELRIDDVARDVLGEALDDEVRVAFRTVAAVDTMPTTPPDTTPTTPPDTSTSMSGALVIYPSRHSEPLWDDPAGGRFARPRALFPGDTIWLHAASGLYSYPPRDSLGAEWQSDEPSVMSVGVLPGGREAFAVAMAPGTVELRASIDQAVGVLKLQVFEPMPSSMLVGVRLDIARDASFVVRENADGTGVVRLASETSLGQRSESWPQYIRGFPGFPAWRNASARQDGRLATNRGGVSVTDEVGGALRVLVPPLQLGWEACLAWSPDGRFIAYTTYEEWDNLYLVDTETNSVSQLWANRFATCPVWHPDGGRLIVTAPDQRFPPWPSMFALQVYSVSLDRPGWGDALFRNMIAGPFAPDGQTLLAVDLKGDLYRATAAGQLLEHIAGVAKVSPVAWSPDGRLIAMPYYLMSADGRYARNFDGEILGFAP
jgi:hypothetical protein